MIGCKPAFHQQTSGFHRMKRTTAIIGAIIGAIIDAIIDALIGLLVFLSFSSGSHAQRISSPVEYVNRSVGTYATKYYFKNKLLVRHVTQIGNRTTSRSSQGDTLYRKNRHSLAAWTIRHGNSIYKMDATGKIVGGSKQSATELTI